MPLIGPIPARQDVLLSSLRITLFGDDLRLSKSDSNIENVWSACKS